MAVLDAMANAPIAPEVSSAPALPASGWLPTARNASVSSQSPSFLHSLSIIITIIMVSMIIVKVIYLIRTISL